MRSFSGRVITYDPEKHLQMKVDSLNSTPGTLTEMDCPKCKNRGYSLVIRDQSFVARECSCMPIRKCLRKLEASGLSQLIRDMTFDAYQAEEAWQQTVKQGAMEYADAPEGWFLLSGQSGCGKTHLCTAICGKLLRDGKAVRYMPWREEIAALKAMSLDYPERSRLLEELKKAEVLYIDDFFKGGTDQEGMNPTAADGNLAFELLNYRDINHLPTILSTQLQSNELLGIDAAIAGRIFYRCGKHLYNIKQDAKRNYRLRNTTYC